MAKKPAITPEEMMELSKEERNSIYLNRYRDDLMMRLDEIAYRIEHTKNKKLRAKLEKDFDRRMALVIQISSGNASLKTH